MNELETPLAYGPSEEQTGFEPVGKAGFRRIATAKWLVVTAFALPLLMHQIVLPIWHAEIVQTVSLSAFSTILNIICGLMLLAAYWRLYGVPRQTYRVGAILLASACVYDVVCGQFVANLLGSVMATESSYAYSQGILATVPSFIITLLALIAFCWRGGANIGAASLIVAIQVMSYGTLFIQMLPINIIGEPLVPGAYIGLALKICAIWAWWMFFKCSDPDAESEDCEPLTASALLLNRVTIGVCAVMLIMVIVLPRIASIILKA